MTPKPRKQFLEKRTKDEQDEGEEEGGIEIVLNQSLEDNENEKQSREDHEKENDEGEEKNNDTRNAKKTRKKDEFKDIHMDMSPRGKESLASSTSNIPGNSNAKKLTHRSKTHK